ncbi:hypothetical protein SI65_06459 [Aspergillus cristatus]|uniref:Zn(2)-C6 fungal-type domain-containing protein n=1 Tax=Aspergillus cristatus TaxID=573508 RepID=A0A1E3BA53_ASPCR|nr:hypothetical protein SI65_06459 [Aspergillus cristatus]
MGTRRRACDRCRRQKLKCDVEKPCSLCVRSGFACETTSAPLRESQKSRKTAVAKRQNADHVRFNGVPPARPDTAFSDPSQERVRDNQEWEENRSELLPEPHRYAQVSAIELTDELFQIHDQGSVVSPAENDTTSALPGGDHLSRRDHARRGNERRFSLSSQFQGLILPSRRLCDFLLQSYWDSVHWFMMVFDEEAFKREYREILGSQSVAPQQMGTAVLILMVLAMGARYAADDKIGRVGVNRQELQVFQNNMLDQIRARFFDVLDMGDVECVQLCILLSSFYLYNGKPNLAFPILGAGTRSAQVQGLHNEALWRIKNMATVEVRRRTWWALYVLERFASMTYGRPSSIDCTFCDVKMPQDMNDTLIVHPLLNSMEFTNKQPRSRVTLGTYQRAKFELYCIAAPIMGKVYSFEATVPTSVMEQAAEINTQLVEWFSQLPPELRLDRNVNLDTSKLSTSEVKVCQLFQLQALVLQLAYDNIQIILHRPFLRHNRSLLITPATHALDARPTSFEQCKHCARRTCSILPRYTQVLLAAQNTHAAAYIAMQNFTAGVTLGMVALSNPSSEQSHDAKKGVANSISLQKALAASSIVPSQTVKVLEALFRLIFQREMQSLLGNQPFDIESPRGYTNNQIEADEGYDRSAPTNSGDTCQMEPMLSHEARQTRQAQSTCSVPGGTQEDGLWGEPASGYEGDENVALHADPGIDQALESIQQVLCEHSDSMFHSAPGVSNSHPQNTVAGQPRSSMNDFSDSLPFPSPQTSMNSAIDPVTQGLIGFNDPLFGQTWMWNWNDFH